MNSSTRLSEILRQSGPWTQVYIDDSVDTADPPQVVRTRRESVIDRLRRSGAPDADVAAVREVLSDPEPVPSPMCRFVLVRQGVVELHEALSGVPLEPEIVGHFVIPDVVPLLKHQPEAMSYVVVETDRVGGEVRLYQVGQQIADAADHYEGRTDSLHKPQAGGWRHDRFQHHVEEIWRQTQSQLAKKIDEVVRNYRPRLLVIAGDIRARQLLENELSFESQAILAVQAVNTRAEGSDESALNDFVAEHVERILTEVKASAVEQLELHRGRGDNTVEVTKGAIVQALAAAQVDTLILDTNKLRDREVLALDAEPWIAVAPEDALNATVLGSVPAQGALSRAAILTDAKIVFLTTNDDPDDPNPVVLPDDAAAAALLRWRTGPPVPGA
ncbi:MAG: hypothetical protein JWM51_337 [Microbacteriaceae bacterium]|jgi:hypothetical protein|nr:hypothetical protein [Microbacteriaceae bacterium]